MFPAHGAGSACGKALGALPSTTVGYERKYAWWSDYLKNDDEQGFIDELLDGQRVAVIDDDIRNIFSMTALLEDHGIEVVSAESGAAGLIPTAC